MISKLFKGESVAISAITIIFIFSSTLIAHEQQWVLYPTFLLACITAVFSYLAYKHTKEKFRLDLLEKRTAYYDLFLSLCRETYFSGPFRPEEWQNIIEKEQNFRLYELPKMKFLFGNIITNLYESYKNSLNWLDDNPDSEWLEGEERLEWNKNKRKHRENIIDIANSLDKNLSPYLDFSDFKK